IGVLVDVLGSQVDRAGGGDSHRRAGPEQLSHTFFPLLEEVEGIASMDTWARLFCECQPGRGLIAKCVPLYQSRFSTWRRNFLIGMASFDMGRAFATCVSIGNGRSVTSPERE